MLTFLGKNMQLGTQAQVQELKIKGIWDKNRGRMHKKPAGDCAVRCIWYPCACKKILRATVVRGLKLVVAEVDEPPTPPIRVAKSSLLLPVGAAVGAPGVAAGAAGSPPGAGASGSALESNTTVGAA